jgi:hypothetical protein
MNLKAVSIAATLVVAASIAPAPARANSSIVIDLAGWATFGVFNAPTNTSARFTLPAGSTVTGFAYDNLVFTTEGASWMREFTFALANSTFGTAIILEAMNWQPSSSQVGGTFSGSGAWGGASGVPSDVYGAGAPFTVGDAENNLWVVAYESFDDPLYDEGVVRDALVQSGTLTVYYTAPIPEPATYGLMAMGLLGVGTAARRRIAQQVQG